jgi:hypothetical protein
MLHGTAGLFDDVRQGTVAGTARGSRTNRGRRIAETWRESQGRIKRDFFSPFAS